MNATVAQAAWLEAAGTFFPGGAPAKRVRAQAGRMVLRSAGWVCIAAGAVLVLYAFAPPMGTLGLIGGHSADPQSDLDAMLEAVKARIPVLAVGFGLLVVGAVVEAAAKGSGRERFDEQVRQSLVRVRCALCGAPVPAGARSCTGGHEQ